MTGYDYDAEDAFEEYLCFSAVLAQKLQTASDAIENLAEEENPEPDYVRAVVDSVMKPVIDLMEHKINRYPWSPEIAEKIAAMCGGRETARSFIQNQYVLYEEYYTLLPVAVAKEKVDAQWEMVRAGFEAVLLKI
ncbi:MAG TPA: hypothetical protein O0X70_03485 [Methanocorpusculum sp.]|nr:hypothetical protein [Methanocorpusculum sp.]